MHGCPAAQIVQARSPVGPTLMPVPQWWRHNVPLCLPDVADWPIVELPDETPRPPGRSSYKKARRPAAPPATGAHELVAPPAAHLNSTTEHMDPWVVLDLNSPPRLATEGRQAPWSGSALASPPWALAVPAPNSPVTTQSVDNNIDVGLGRCS